MKAATSIMRVRLIRKCLGINRQKCLWASLLVSTAVVVIFLQKHINIHAIKSEYFRNFHGFVGNDPNVTSWISPGQRYSACHGNFVGFGHQFAVLRNVLLKPNDKKFYIPCDGEEYSTLQKYSFKFGKEGTHMNAWLKTVARIQDHDSNLAPTKTKSQNNLVDFDNKLVIVVQRYEYANLYHQMTDWYNAFLVSKLLSYSHDNVYVMLNGRNVKGPLDDIWENLFNKVIYTEEIGSPLTIPTMAWNMIGYESPLNYHSRTELPYLEDFHNFVFQKYHSDNTNILNCDKLSIVFLWRRDYVSHAGNTAGVISRKIKNEDELINVIQARYPLFSVSGEQLDKHEFKKQLEIIAKTDILISMHGAGLSHVLFLPQHSGVIELYPLYWTKYFGMKHFRSMARWRKLKYASWQNLNPFNEYANFYTQVPPQVLQETVEKIVKQICPNTSL